MVFGFGVLDSTPLALILTVSRRIFVRCCTTSFPPKYPPSFGGKLHKKAKKEESQSQPCHECHESRRRTIISYEDLSMQ
jgi:hypothetical protein